MDTEHEVAPAAVGTLTQTDPALRKLITDAAAVVAEATDYRIETQDDLDMAGELLARIKGEMKRAEAERKTANKPDEDRVKARNNAYRPITDSLSKAEATLKAAVGAYLREQENRRRELQRQEDEKKRLALEEATTLMQDREDPVAQATADEMVRAAAAMPAVKTVEKPATVIQREEYVPVILDPTSFGIVAVQEAALGALAYLDPARKSDPEADRVASELASALHKAVPFEYLRVEPAIGAMKNTASRTNGAARIRGVTFEKQISIGSKAR